jgi:hypothetical protein
VKAFRSPWVSGGLTAAALAFVAYQAIGGRGHARTYAPLEPVPATASVPAASAPVAKPPAGAGHASRNEAMDRSYLVLHFTNWSHVVRRDPFLLYAPAQTKPGTNGPSPLAKWKLKGIWRQTGSSVVALNEALYQEGDMIEGYKIVRIEDEVVWFQNADSLHHLEFGKRRIPPTLLTKGTNTPALLP